MTTKATAKPKTQRKQAKRTARTSKKPVTLSDDQLTDVSGGRITNIRANASGLGGGGLAGTTSVL